VHLVSQQPTFHDNEIVSLQLSMGMEMNFNQQPHG